MTSLFEVFMMAAEGDPNRSFALAGLPQVAELLAKSGTSVTTDTLSGVYAQMQWQADRTLSWQEFSELAMACGLHPEIQQAELTDAAVPGSVTLPSAEEPNNVQKSTSESSSLADAIL